MYKISPNTASKQVCTLLFVNWDAITFKACKEKTKILPSNSLLLVKTLLDTVIAACSDAKGRHQDMSKPIFFMIITITLWGPPSLIHSL